MLDSLILAAAIIGATQPPNEHVPPKPQTFSPYKTFPQYELNLDSSTFSIVGEGISMLVMMDIQVIMTVPMKHAGSSELVKSYTNSLAIDCTFDRLFVLAGKAYSTSGKTVYTVPKPEVVYNERVLRSPVSEIMDFACKPFNADRNKDLRKLEPKTGPAKLRQWV